MDLTSFYSAFNLLLTTAKQSVNSVNENPSNVVKFCKILNEARDNQRVHIVGMGRSGKVGMLFGEMLKNIGFSVSYLGKSLSKPVRTNDIVIGVTGSGWTNFTIKAMFKKIVPEYEVWIDDCISPQGTEAGKG